MKLLESVLQLKSVCYKASNMYNEYWHVSSWAGIPCSVVYVENGSSENSTADSDDKLACHLSYTHLFPEYAEDLLSWQNGATEESQQISMQGFRF